jgi:probable phosphoglycerate mutase
MKSMLEGPAAIWLLRHGESAGNVAALAAETAHQGRIDIATRDMDTPLSPAGRDQAAAAGRRLAAFPETDRPESIICSPYVRAVTTADIALAAAGLTIPCSTDERLREREFGSLDRLTREGIIAQFPEQAEARRFLGKFYYRPPGGESWCDVLLRVRSFLESQRHDGAGRRLLLVTHQVVILMVRYVLEGLDERSVLEVDRTDPVANCALTRLSPAADGSWRLEAYNEVEHLAAEGTPQTTAPDVPVGPR